MSDSIVSHARAREAEGGDDESRSTLLERAREMLLDLGRPPNPRERFWFILDARKDDLYVRGESSALLAEVWGLGTNAVERSACEVHNALVDPAGMERARDWIALESRRRSEELWERSRRAADRDAAPLAQAADAAMEKHGRVTGAIAATGAVNVLVDARTGAPRPEVVREIERAHEEALALTARAARALGISDAAWSKALADAAESDAAPALLVASGEELEG